jgi:hydroxyacylglutathione hydrolase
MLHVKIFLFNPLEENTYLVYNESNECIIIDPGCYYDDEKAQVADFITKNSLKPVKLLNTHCHLDHVFGNKFIAEEYGLTLHIHPNEKPLLEYAPASGLMWNIPFDNYLGELAWLHEGDVIELGNDRLKILFIPGHSPGSLGFYCENQGFVISGDTLFQLSIGRTDLPGGDFKVLENSIRTALYTLPESTVIYPGHGPSTTVGIEKRSNPFVKA